MLKRSLIALTLVLFALPALACVGKTLIIGTDSTPESRAIAQVLAVLINERTGTTVEIVDHKGAEELFKEMTGGDVDLALEYTGRALKRAGKQSPADPAAAIEEARKAYMESFNLVLLTAFGFQEPGQTASPAVTAAQKHALKKFPALPRLIAKTTDLIPPETLKNLSTAQNPAVAARDFLKKNKLI